jgi:hypothetical protein
VRGIHSHKRAKIKGQAVDRIGFGTLKNGTLLDVMYKIVNRGMLPLIDCTEFERKLVVPAILGRHSHRQGEDESNAWNPRERKILEQHIMRARARTTLMRATSRSNMGILKEGRRGAG